METPILPPPKSVKLFVTAKNLLILAKAVVLFNIVFMDKTESIVNIKKSFLLDSL
ncbi:MAG TPA: hypothetical protein VFZ46_00885 [Nitrososphaeraceae archaeon]